MGASRGSPRSLPQVAETIARKGSSGLSIENVAQAVKAAEPALDSIETKLHATVVCRAIERAMA